MPDVMSFDEAVTALSAHGARQFPKSCSCGRTFATFAEYIRQTTPVNRTISYDAHAGDWAPKEPLGAFAMANCRCGSTLSLSTHGMSLDTHHGLLGFVKSEVERRKVKPDVVAGELRAEVRRRVLADDERAR